MTIISNSSPLATYLASATKPSTTGTSGSTSGTTTGTDGKATDKPADPIAELRQFAANLVAQGRGGLMNAMAGNTSNVLSNASAATRAGLNGGSGAQMQLPDVSTMDRDDAAKMLTQVQKLLDKGLEGAFSFVGVNGDKQTSSLETYRDWLQAKGGISIYA
ncbi:hypothetical protein ACPA5B_00515 [Pseudomonas solani]|uniref:hypothetical protein n=1 Tax=Pseudomonas solani TaxID=2731552 RepID=UPI003C2BC3EE